MFEVYDIISAGIILIILFFLIILFQIEKSFTRPRIYLRTALLFALFIIIIEELISFRHYSIVALLYPVGFALYYTIYPLIYLYSRDLVFDGKDKNRPQLIYFFILPFATLIYLSILFYPLNYDLKVQFMTFYLSETVHGLKHFPFHQYVVIIAYYLQTAFYMAATVKLISFVRNKIDSNLWEVLLVRYLFMYVIAVILYESIILGCTIFLSENTTVIKTTEQLLTLLFISFGLYIAFKQSLILIQFRIHKYADKFSMDIRPVSGQFGISTAGKIIATEQLCHKTLLSENEKLSIKEAIENSIVDLKLHLNPNLKLENLSKRVHIPVRKISVVINEIFGTNFNHFINEHRISEAKKLIARNPQSIVFENIYTKVGFNSRSTFNRVFKESTGISPTDYIKSISQKPLV